MSQLDAKSRIEKFKEYAVDGQPVWRLGVFIDATSQHVRSNFMKYHSHIQDAELVVTKSAVIKNRIGTLGPVSRGERAAMRMQCEEVVDL